MQDLCVGTGIFYSSLAPQDLVLARQFCTYSRIFCTSTFARFPCGQLDSPLRVVCRNARIPEQRTSGFIYANVHCIVTIAIRGPSRGMYVQYAIRTTRTTEAHAHGTTSHTQRTTLHLEGALPQPSLSSALGQPELSPTSAFIQLHFSPSSALVQPRLSPNSASLQF